MKNPTIRPLFPVYVVSLAVLLLLVSGIALSSEPRYGGTFVHAAPTDPHHLAPPLTSSSPTVGPASAVVEALVQLRYRDGSVNIEPLLAESWDISADGTTYTFQLRQGVTWHDGEPFTSADVKFTIEEVVLPYHPLGARVWATLDRIETPDPHTVVVHLEKPFPILELLGIGLGIGGIIPQHLYEGTDIPANPYNARPVGTGPFKFESWDRGERIVLVRNDNYWDETRPYLDRIVWRTVPDNTSIINGLLTGEIDQTDWLAVPYPQIDRLEASPNVRIAETPQASAQQQLIKFNLRHPALGNQLVRQAIAHAVDRELVQDLVFFGLSQPSTAHISSTLGPERWHADKPLNRYDYDVEKANQLLDEAGFPRDDDGNRFSIVHTFANLQEFQLTFSTVLAEQLAEVGIEVTPRVLDYAAFLERVYTDWDFDIMSHTLSHGPLPEFFVSRFYVSSNIQPGITFSNAMGYVNEEIDSLWDTVPFEADPEQRREQFYRIQDILADELPLLPIWEVYFPLPVSVEFHNTGLSPHQAGGDKGWRDIWWENAPRTAP